MTDAIKNRCYLKKNSVEKISYKIYNKEKIRSIKVMTKNAESLEAVYIYRKI